jgi:hypothetical protein
MQPLCFKEFSVVRTPVVGRDYKIGNYILWIRLPEDRKCYMSIT